MTTLPPDPSQMQPPDPTMDGAMSMDPSAADPTAAITAAFPSLSPNSAMSVLMQMFGIDKAKFEAAQAESIQQLQGAVGVIQEMLAGPPPETLNGPAGTESQALGDMPEQSTPVMRGGPYA